MRWEDIAAANGAPGIVSLSSWTMMPDGEVYQYVWAPHWVITTDKEFPTDGFHSSEKWQLWGCHLGAPLVLIPGCGVKGFAVCAEPPKRQCLYRLGEDS